ncbi:bacteriohemerythrin [Salidesulfovibrio brasiliensis]|uniref:bacteriohemerythrin n=1 Tax=Salidesulfovibrio brasiliensis TaxID=221711 RepID=UPI0006CF9FDC|nr:bacteriohemerythrin [Salidesulfovibrio brasiliensis]
MARINWDESLETGIYSIDSQHMDLVGMCNDFLDAVSSGKTEQAVNALVRRLREYCVQHFHDEEETMAEMGYPRLGEHQREHRRLSQQVKEYQRDLYKKRTPQPLEVRDFLKDWLLGHILGMDMKIAEWLKEREAEQKESKVVIGEAGEGESEGKEEA